MNSTHIIGSILGLCQALTLYLLSRVKKDTSQVNSAVNHIEPGSPTLKQQMDVVFNDLTVVKAVAVADKAEVNKKLDALDLKTDSIRGMVAELGDAQTIVSKELSKIRESVDRRKEPR